MSKTVVEHQIKTVPSIESSINFETGETTITLTTGTHI